jgi:hypothetical protein
MAFVLAAYPGHQTHRNAVYVYGRGFGVYLEIRIPIIKEFLKRIEFVSILEIHIMVASDDIHILDLILKRFKEVYS